MNKQSFIHKRAFHQAKQTEGQADNMSFDSALEAPVKSFSRFKKIQNPILAQKARFQSSTSAEQ